MKLAICAGRDLHNLVELDSYGLFAWHYLKIEVKVLEIIHAQ